ncbi:MAG TPA: PAS domain S-box protein [Bacteroidia bacterium]|nr:PAS domain S-box protein [Bacteroidia bacterium]
MNKLLLRQINKQWGSLENVPEGFQDFLKAVDETYTFSDRDRTMLERSIELSSSELVGLNGRLREESIELAKAHNELKTLFENIDTVFFTVDMTCYKVIQMSASCEKIYGHTAEDFLANSNLWFEVILEEDKHVIESNYPLMYAGKRFSHENRICAKDGTIRWVETKITPTLGDDGQVTRIDGITSDITLRKEAEEKSRLNEIRFRRLIEKSHDGISLLSAEGKLLYASPSVERILGYTSAELIDTDPAQFTHPDDLPKVVEVITVLMSQPGETANAVYRMKNKAGDWRWISSNITNLLFDNSINAIVFNYEDITVRVLAQQQSESDRSNRDAMINSTNDLMWSLDKNFCMITANQGFLGALNMMIPDRQSAPGDCLLDYLSFEESTLTRWRGLYERALSGEAFTYENHEEVPFDTWGEVSFNPIFENGEVVGASCFWRDITEKKKNEEQLRASERMMAEAQRISKFGSWELSFDANQEIMADSITWSTEVFRIYGYEDYSNVPHFDERQKHIHPNDHELATAWLTSILNGESVSSVDYRIFRIDGSIRWVKVSGAMVIDDQTGKRVKMIGTIQDITERKGFEQERTQIAKDLLQRNKALEQFAYIVSHNLRAPVANILGLSHLIRNTSLTGEAHMQCINGLTKSVESLDQIIIDLNDILHVKRNITEKRDVVNFHSLVRNISDSIRMTMEEEKVVISTDFSQTNELFTIKNYLYSIFYNLISNSIKYRKPNLNPLIHISSQVLDKKTILTFRDNGLGIDLNMHGDKVFGLYKRFHLDVKGKGMGLYMVKTQVESLGGKIDIKSEVNKGTEIMIEF